MVKKRHKRRPMDRPGQMTNKGGRCLMRFYSQGT